MDQNLLPVPGDGAVDADAPAVPLDRSFCNQLVELVLCCDARGLVAYANPAALRCGAPPAGQPLLDLITAEAAPKAALFLEEAHHSGAPGLVWELPLRHDHGQTVGRFRGYRREGFTVVLGEIDPPHLATAITQSIMAQLAGELLARPPLGRTLLATCIGGEHHEVGIRMVSDFFELDGWDVIYLGANVPIPDVVQMVVTQRADLLAISVTLSGHVTKARDLIAAVRASPSGARCRIMVGGQPFVRSPDLCAVVGADFTACDAREAVQRAQKALLS